jgi:hypothetical protein
LAISRGTQSHLHAPLALYQGDRDEEAFIYLGAIGGNGIDLGRRVVASDEAIRPTPAAREIDSDDISVLLRPLALDAEKPLTNAKSQLIPLVLGRDRS